MDCKERKVCLSSAHVASRKPFQPVFGRAGSAHPSEYPCKVLLAFETAGDGNIQDPRLGGAQQFFATLYPMSQDKLMRCLARGHAKHLREIRGAKARCLCHFSETCLVLNSCLHQLCNPSKARRTHSAAVCLDRGVPHCMVVD